MTIKNNILIRVYLAFGLILFLAAAVIFQLYNVQVVQGAKWKAMASTHSTQYKTIVAAKGNILGVDGSLLATSVPEYELHMDMLAIADDRVFNEKVDSLAEALADFKGDRSAREYSRLLREGRKDGERYLVIRRKVSFADLKQIRTFPIFNLGKYKGGLIPFVQNTRILPYQSLAARTIGYNMNNDKMQAVGIEGSFAKYIEGTNGRRLMQRIAGGAWVPVSNGNGDDEVEPKDGADVISTIDVNYQDVAQKALKAQLDSSKAEHGCVVLMEVATGEIRAIANFKKTSKGTYEESYNYAISNAVDPGSTFKLATYMTLFDQHKIDTNTVINAGGGHYKIPRGPMITDVENNNYEMTAKRAFEESSNVAAAKFVYNNYINNPKEFTDGLYSYHLNEKLGLQIQGEGTPVIKNPKSRTWNKYYTLPEMAYGYEMKITPLQMLTFYNSVANNGKMIAPIFVKEVRRMGTTIQQFQARVINEKVCSDATLGKMKNLLEGVITDGNCKKIIKNPLYSVAGKTGTAQIADGAAGYGKKTYQASFCGYFPANHPKYSMIVVISNPTAGSYLAAKVAGPVFRKIADRIYSSDLEVNQAAPVHLVGNTNLPQTKKGNMKAVKQVYSSLGLKPLYASNNTAENGVDTSNGVVFEEDRYKAGVVPQVTGMGLSDAMYMMGNAGYKVAVHGSGIVKSQSVTGGSNYPKGSKIIIELQ